MISSHPCVALVVMFAADSEKANLADAREAVLAESTKEVCATQYDQKCGTILMYPSPGQFCDGSSKLLPSARAKEEEGEALSRVFPSAYTGGSKSHL